MSRKTKQLRPASEENKRIVDEIVRSGILTSILTKIVGGKLKESHLDLEQDLLFSLLLNDRLSSIYERGELNFYLAKILMNNLASKTSPYYRQYVRYELNERWDKDHKVYEQKLYEEPPY